MTRKTARTLIFPQNRRKLVRRTRRALRDTPRRSPAGVRRSQLRSSRQRGAGQDDQGSSAEVSGCTVSSISSATRLKHWSPRPHGSSRSSAGSGVAPCRARVDRRDQGDPPGVHGVRGGPGRRQRRGVHRGEQPAELAQHERARRPRPGAAPPRTRCWSAVAVRTGRRRRCRSDRQLARREPSTSPPRRQHLPGRRRVHLLARVPAAGAGAVAVQQLVEPAVAPSRASRSRRRARAAARPSASGRCCPCRRAGR